MKKIIKNYCGQSTMEFIFSMMVTVLLIIGLIRVFTWTGRELVGRSQAHEDTLTDDIKNNCTAGAGCPLRQLRPDFYRGTSLNAAVNSNIFGRQ